MLKQSKSVKSCLFIFWSWKNVIICLGKNCEINIDECSPMPCKEGSTCVDGINEFTCICVPGLSGKLCDINIDDCEVSSVVNSTLLC